MPSPNITPYGDTALLVEFAPEINVAINQQVHQLAKLAMGIKGVNACVPAYNSLLIHFSPEKKSYKKLAEKLHKQIGKLQSVGSLQGKLHRIPVCYHNSLGLDWEEVMAHTKLSKDEIIQLHTQQPYHVFMMGFLLGFGYLGKLDHALQCPRKGQPRKQVPKGAVGIAGWQTGIYPSSAPGGWQIIGQTPINMLGTEQSPSPILQAGDAVQFYEISLEEYFDRKKGNPENPCNLGSLVNLE